MIAIWLVIGLWGVFVLYQFCRGVILLLRVSDDIDAEECNPRAHQSSGGPVEHGPTKKEIS